jgi:hypothetical protein
MGRKKRGFSWMIFDRVVVAREQKKARLISNNLDLDGLRKKIATVHIFKKIKQILRIKLALQVALRSCLPTKPFNILFLYTFYVLAGLRNA